MTASKPVAEECEEALDRVDEVSRLQSMPCLGKSQKVCGKGPRSRFSIAQLLRFAVVSGIGAGGASHYRLFVQSLFIESCAASEPQRIRLSAISRQLSVRQ